MGCGHRGTMVGVNPMVLADIGLAMGMAAGWQAAGRRGRQKPPYVVGGVNWQATLGRHAQPPWAVIPYWSWPGGGHSPVG